MKDDNYIDAGEEQVDNDEIIILKIGGSSITNKAHEETFNEDALDWFAKLVSDSIDTSFLSTSNRSDAHQEDNVEGCTKSKPQFIMVHGAGSFGHHCAKRYGLRCGKAVFLEEVTNNNQHIDDDRTQLQQRYQMEGLSKTRQSVQKLNAATVNCLIKYGVNAVGISPGMAIPNLRAHGATTANDDNEYTKNEYDGSSSSCKGMQDLCQSIKQALNAGLVPVLHGDACLLYDGRRAGILGGDTIVEGISTVWNDRDASYEMSERRSTISKVIFITDVAGVFSSDPKSNENAFLIRSLKVDKDTGRVTIEKKDGGSSKIDEGNKAIIANDALLNVSGSSHEHDVTGGLKAKLSAAISVVQTGVDVIISQCGHDSTERFVRGDWVSIWDVKAGTLLSQ